MNDCFADTDSEEKENMICQAVMCSDKEENKENYEVRDFFPFGVRKRESRKYCILFTIKKGKTGNFFVSSISSGEVAP